ncbi:MAG: DUF1385 domain-containing protein [Ruminococcaceae bacterium]|nr:DUF1385 domain-containing protein [Oscillospiraceae bacterium]
MKQEKQAHKTSIGGQALIEGVMMRGPKTTAMAVRNPEGEIVLEKWDTPANKKAKIFKLPFIRGIFNMVDSLRFGYKCLMRSAEIAGLEEEENEQDEKKNKFIMGILMVFSVVLAVFLSVGLFIYLPSLLFKLLANAVPSLDNRIWRGIFEGCLRIVIFVGYMCIMLLMKDIRRTFMYHGAEHKTIFCYEAGLELSVENVRKMRRFHPRCGTSFMILVLLVGIIVSMFINVDAPLLRTAIKLLTLPVVVGVGYELIKFAGRHDNLLTRIISAPGVWLQHITTIEPDDGQIECAIAALSETLTGNREDDKW